MRECDAPTSTGTTICGGEEGSILRPVHEDCFEKLQTKHGLDLSDEIMVEIRGFVVANHETEQKRERLREEAEELRARCETAEHPTEQEVRAFSDKVREFVASTPPELLWPEIPADPKEMKMNARDRVAQEALAAYDIKEAYRQLGEKGWQDYTGQDGNYVARIVQDDGREVEVTARVYLSEDYGTVILALAGYYPDAVRRAWVLGPWSEAGRDRLIGDWVITEHYGRDRALVSLASDNAGFDGAPTPREASPHYAPLTRRNTVSFCQPTLCSKGDDSICLAHLVRCALAQCSVSVLASLPSR